MSYTFFGTPEISAKILNTLITNDFRPSLVVTNPDKPHPSPVKLLAAQHKISVFQPTKLDLEECREKFRGMEFGILFSYGKIIPAYVISLFPKGIIVIHPSLLPRHRGATPVPTAILEGDEETGTTLFLMDEKVDHGPILAQAKLKKPIDHITTPELFEKLIKLSNELLLQILPKFIRGQIAPQPQDESVATYTKKFAPELGYVDLLKDKPKIIDRKIRALNPEPGVYTIFDTPLPKEVCKVTLPLQQRIKLLSIKKEKDYLTITRIQAAGKTPQDIAIHIK